MDSLRFGLPIQITRHAKDRMAERGISNDLLLDLIETGTAKHKDEKRLWLFKRGRNRVSGQQCAGYLPADFKPVRNGWQLHFELGPVLPRNARLMR